MVITAGMGKFRRNTVVTVMMFCGNDIQRKNWTVNMYAAEELWSLCWTHVFNTVAYNKNSIWKNERRKNTENHKKWIGWRWL